MGERFDVLIRGGTVVDGTGAPRYRADVGIDGERIARIGDLADATAELVVDAAGKAVSPGFVDVHTHDDRLLLSDPSMAAKTSQGVTTVVVGNCGVSLAPFVAADRPVPPLDLLGDAAWYRFPSFDAYLSEVETKRAAANAVFLIGHQTLRVGTMDAFDRAATAPEIAAMSERIEEAMNAGAAGFSTGLFYPPARHAPTDEIVELAKVAARHGGLYATHMRDEGPRLEDSIEETLSIGKRAGLPVVVSHHKAIGVPNHGKVVKTLARLEAAAQEQPVAFDVYPYAASSTVLLPDRVADATRVLVTWSEKMPEVAGRDLAEIAAEHGVSPIEMAQRLVPAGAIYFAMSEDDVARVVAHPMAMIGSDGLPHDPRPHPRLWGTFARVLGYYCREQDLMPLEEAVRRMTGLSAETFGLADRGVLREGAFADVVVFDPATIHAAADFHHPTRPTEGIDIVLANGTPVWRMGESTGERPGKALRRRRAA